MKWTAKNNTDIVMPMLSLIPSITKLPKVKKVVEPIKNTKDESGGPHKEARQKEGPDTLEINHSPRKYENISEKINHNNSFFQFGFKNSFQFIIII